MQTANYALIVFAKLPVYGPLIKRVWLKQIQWEKEPVFSKTTIYLPAAVAAVQL